jgi:hypothetical protein
VVDHWRRTDRKKKVKSILEYDALMAGTLLLTFRLILLPVFCVVDNIFPRFGGHYCRRRLISVRLFQKLNNLSLTSAANLRLHPNDTSSTDTSLPNYQATLLKIRKTVSFIINAVKTSNRMNSGKTDIVTTQPTSAPVQNTSWAHTSSRSLDATNNPHMLH